MKPDQISNTAAFIAVKFYGLTRDERYRALFDSDTVAFYEKLVQFLPAPIRYYHRGLQFQALRKFFIFWEELLLPGDLMHILLRKWYLSRWVTELRENSYEQMLVLGAGFDHLAALNVGNNFHCVELEPSKMASLKREFLAHAGYDHPHLAIENAYFGRDGMAEILSQKTTLNPEKKTVVVAEGFFDYLKKTHTELCLQSVQSFFDDDVMLLSTLFSLGELPSFRSFVYKNSIRLASEQLQLGLGRNEYLSLLGDHHFIPQQTVSSAQMKREVLEPQSIDYPVLDGFYLIKAKLNGEPG